MKNKTLKLTPIIVFLIAAFFLVLIPFKIIGYGFIPPDDASRHAAKVISGKDWSQILVLRPEIKMDSHPGWHAVLGAVRHVTGWDANSLVLFSVISLFVLFVLAPLFLMRFPESWLAALVTLAIAAPFTFSRLLLGRPYIFTMTFLVILCLSWRKLKGKELSLVIAAALTILMAASTWIHCSWYLFVMPLTAFLLAREWRVAAIFCICAGLGIAAGAALTGHPVMFLKQTLTHLFLAFGNNDAEYMLVSEFRPSFGDFNIAMAVVVMIGWRVLRGRKIKEIIDDPVFILGVMGFFMAVFARRTWLDWGFPAIAVWMALSFDDIFVAGIDRLSWRRLPIAILLAAALYSNVTADVGSRWTSCRPLDYLSADDPKQAEWMPGPGGIIYSDSMDVFYRTFYRNPNAKWRYILGFEPALMPDEDLKIFRNIQRNRWTYKPFDAWVAKMRPEDRLIISGAEGSPPKIPGLEWNYAAINTWIGRLPRNQK